MSVKGKGTICEKKGPGCSFVSDWIEEGRGNQRWIRDFCWKNATHDQEAGGNGTDYEIHVRLKELVV